MITSEPWVLAAAADQVAVDERSRFQAEAEEGGHRFGQRQLESAAAEAVVGRQGRGLLQPGQGGLGIVGVQVCEK